MKTLEELLQKWNNGILRGARRRLAEELGINEATKDLKSVVKSVVSIKISPRFAGIFLAAFKFFSHGKLFFFTFVPALHRTQITYHAAINLAGRAVARVLFGF